MVGVTDKPIVPQDVADSLKTDVSGSVVTHTAILRASEGERKLVSMEYQASGEAAGKELSQIETEIRGKWEIQDIALWRRMGRVSPGEVILVAAVSAPHRKEAFQACEYAVEKLRGMTSVKRREIYERTGGRA